jgi:hypothetical protein
VNKDSKLIFEAYGSSISREEQNPPYGYPGGVTAIQNTLMNELKRRGYELTKISHTDKERDKYPTVFMHKKDGPMHTVAEISGVGEINGESFKDYMNNIDGEENAESPARYDAMHGLVQAANQIKELLQGAANDEARTDHIEKMAEIILGPQSEYASVTEYRRILGGVIELLNHYVVVPMN